MILIESHRPGAMWLRAMFRYYCRKHNSSFVIYPNGTMEALGPQAKDVHFDYERAYGTLQITIINALASVDSEKTRSVRAKVTRDFVKKLYREDYVQGG